MAATYTRLSALDATFLDVETESAHMHVGAVSIFDAAPLRDDVGDIDITKIERLIEHTFRRFPRYRQKLAWIPVFGHPVWIDDERFNLHYHVRHTALPSPGDERQLKRLAGRILSQQLDRGKPLWEMWVVEGLEHDRVAVISKAHHCMIDGVGGVELIGTTMGTSPREIETDELPAWRPRRRPSAPQLLVDEVLRLASEPVSATRAAFAAILHPLATVKTVREGVVGIAQAVSTGIRGASETPLNVKIGPHRKFDWMSLELADLKDIRAELGGTLNDLVLTIASGAIGRFLTERGIDVKHLDFRAMVPVNFRSTEDRGALGNRITMVVAHLPVGETDAVARLERVRAETLRLKSSKEASGVKVLELLSEVTTHGLFAAFANLSALSRAYNVVVTNVPGPQFETYLMRSPMRAVYPLVPLNRNQALGVAVFSYFGRLFWGFNADFDEVPDLHELVLAVREEFEALRDAAVARRRSSTHKPDTAA